jgi:cytochrome c
MTLSTKTIPLLALLLCGPALAQETVGKGDSAPEGQILFNNACRTCHTLREGDNRLGPNLHKVVGRKAGSLPNYGYSSALKGADITWDKAALDRFIANPDQVVSGHNMKPYGGLASADERAKIIAFLEAQN